MGTQRSKYSLVVGVCLLGFACDVDEPPSDRIDEREAALHVALDGPVVEGADMFEIKREAGVVTYKLETVGMPPGEVVTVWLGGFNQPWNCSGAGPLAHGQGECGLLDWTSPTTYEDTGVFWKLAHGEIVGEDGELKFSMVDDPDEPTEFGPQLDFDNAEIQIWVRSHGLPIPDRLDEQLTQSQGGCDVNPCLDLQIAVLPNPHD